MQELVQVMLEGMFWMEWASLFVAAVPLVKVWKGVPSGGKGCIYIGSVRKGAGFIKGTVQRQVTGVESGTNR